VAAAPGAAIAPRRALSESRARFEEAYDIITRAWTEDIFSCQGKFWSEAETVVAETVDLLPGIEVLGIGAHRDVGPEVTRRKRVGEFAAHLQMVEVFAVGEQIENEDFHGAPIRACVTSRRRRPVPA
jgi:hypothetical protein